MEEEARALSQKPKQMNSFSESRKADQSLVTGKFGAAPAKEATPPVEEDVGGDKGQGGNGLTTGSPRNVGLLKKLATRERGGGKADKKAGGKK